MLVNFPLPTSGPVFLRTVDPGSHFEFSTFTLVGDATWGQNLNAGARVDVGNLYDRNPTSSGKDVIVHDAWLRFGREIRPATLPEGFGGYLKVGKFGHFERQNDRHLESWGLLSTSFNRFPDVGLEGGLDLGRFFYVKASLTAGNPVFIRDPNALAGDNGTEQRLRQPPFDKPPVNSRFVIPYDTEVQTTKQTPADQRELRAIRRQAGNLTVDVLAFARQRKLRTQSSSKDVLRRRSRHPEWTEQHGTPGWTLLAAARQRAEEVGRTSGWLGRLVVLQPVRGSEDAGPSARATRVRSPALDSWLAAGRQLSPHPARDPH